MKPISLAITTMLLAFCLPTFAQDNPMGLNLDQLKAVGNISKGASAFGKKAQAARQKQKEKQAAAFEGPLSSYPNGSFADKTNPCGLRLVLVHGTCRPQTHGMGNGDLWEGPYPDENKNLGWAGPNGQNYSGQNDGGDPKPVPGYVPSGPHR